MEIVLMLLIYSFRYAVTFSLPNYGAQINLLHAQCLLVPYVLIFGETVPFLKRGALLASVKNRCVWILGRSHRALHLCLLDQEWNLYPQSLILKQLHDHNAMLNIYLQGTLTFPDLSKVINILEAKLAWQRGKGSGGEGIYWFHHHFPFLFSPTSPSQMPRKLPPNPE